MGDSGDDIPPARNPLGRPGSNTRPAAKDKGPRKDNNDDPFAEGESGDDAPPEKPEELEELEEPDEPEQPDEQEEPDEGLFEIDDGPPAESVPDSQPMEGAETGDPKPRQLSLSLRSVQTDSAQAWSIG